MKTNQSPVILNAVIDYRRVIVRRMTLRKRTASLALSLLFSLLGLTSKSGVNPNRNLRTLHDVATLLITTSGMVAIASAQDIQQPPALYAPQSTLPGSPANLDAPYEDAGMGALRDIGAIVNGGFNKAQQLGKDLQDFLTPEGKWRIGPVNVSSKRGVAGVGTVKGSPTGPLFAGLQPPDSKLKPTGFASYPIGKRGPFGISVVGSSNPNNCQVEGGLGIAYPTAQGVGFSNLRAGPIVKEKSIGLSVSANGGFFRPTPVPGNLGYNAGPVPVVPGSAGLGIAGRYQVEYETAFNTREFKEAIKQGFSRYTIAPPGSTYP
jgi:hypothetical protein